MASVPPDRPDAERDRLMLQLTAEVRRAVRDRTPPPSDALRAKLAAMAPAPQVRWRLAPVFAWVSAAAAGLLIAFALGRFAAPTSPRAVPTAAVVPADVVARAEEVHGFCSRLAAGLHNGGYPADVAPLAAAVERDLHSAHPYPDLSAIGYRFRGAGPCGHPLADAAHLLYRSVRPGTINAVSVFVQPWHGQYAIDAGRVYTVSVPTSPFPMLAWRTDRVVYFLLADDAKTEQAALALIRSAPATRP